MNMIRVHGKQEEERNKPEFGSSRAAPLQGADSERPSESSEVRGVGQDRSKRPSMFTQNRKLPEVPSSLTSSGERYGRIGQNRDARPKSSTVQPGYDMKCKKSSILKTENFDKKLKFSRNFQDFFSVSVQNQEDIVESDNNM